MCPQLTLASSSSKVTTFSQEAPQTGRSMMSSASLKTLPPSLDQTPTSCTTGLNGQPLPLLRPVMFSRRTFSISAGTHWIPTAASLHTSTPKVLQLSLVPLLLIPFSRRLQVLLSSTTSPLAQALFEATTLPATLQTPVSLLLVAGLQLLQPTGLVSTWAYLRPSKETPSSK